jgi:hypothetical protein
LAKAEAVVVVVVVQVTTFSTGSSFLNYDVQK